MLPILLSLGPVKIYSYGVMLAIGLFLSLYWWWKMGRDEHFDEIALFDAFFLSVIIYAVTGRLGYVALHFQDLGTVYRIFALLAYPGINVIIGLLSAGIFLLLFARSQTWLAWKAMDAYVVALSLTLSFGGIGAILDGAKASWQVNTWGAVWALASFVLASRVRKDFRFYAWYKGESSIAQEGLASLMFGASVGIYYLGASLLSHSSWKVWLIPGQAIVGMVIVVGCLYLIKQRSGRRESTLWGKLSNIIRRK